MENENNYTEKEKIILVLQESIIRAEKNKMESVAHIFNKVDLYISKTRFKKLVKEKVKYFNNLDENSYTYKFTLNAARESLNELRSGLATYNFQIVNLINIFLGIESIHEKKLKYLSHTDLENPTPIKTREEEKLVFVPGNNKIVYLKSEEKLKSKLQEIEEDELLRQVIL